MIYGREPSLVHLRSFGCLCFATVLKDIDIFFEKSEKCVLIGYASGKKAYKLLSLENRSILYSRDVKFYETVFPFKMGQNSFSISETNSDVTNLNFFDMFESEIATKTSTPNDEDSNSFMSHPENVTSVFGRGGSMHQPVSVGNSYDSDSDEQIPQSVSGADPQPGHDEQHTAAPLDDQNHSEGNSFQNPNEVPGFQNVSIQSEEGSCRRCSRTFKLPAKLNEFVLDGKVKYG